MPRSATIRSLPAAFEMVKAMGVAGLEWGSDYRPFARQAVIGMPQDQMAERVDEHLDAMGRRGQADRRNGSYDRHLLTELGDIALAVPRTRPAQGRAASSRARSRDVPHARALHGNPFDGHTLGAAIADLEAITGVETRRIHVDKGYRGHDHPHRFRVWVDRVSTVRVG